MDGSDGRKKCNLLQKAPKILWWYSSVPNWAPRPAPGCTMFHAHPRRHSDPPRIILLRQSSSSSTKGRGVGPAPSACSPLGNQGNGLASTARQGKLRVSVLNQSDTCDQSRGVGAGRPLGKVAEWTGREGDAGQVGERLGYRVGGANEYARVMMNSQPQCTFLETGTRSPSG